MAINSPIGVLDESGEGHPHDHARIGSTVPTRRR